jgi:TonB family protein
MHLDTSRIAVNIDEDIKLASSSLVNFPAVFGFAKPTIILPENFSEYSLERQAIVLEHELLHVARHDFQINHLKNFIRIVFWFNPLVHIANKFVEADQEMSCDQRVLEKKSYILAANYANCLLQEATTSSPPLLLSQWNDPQLIKERIKMIGRNKSKFWHKYVLSLVACIFVGFSSVIVAHEENAIVEAVPITIVQPAYPRIAAENRQEGEVTFAFDLSDEGFPINLKIIESTPKGVFDQVALKAIKEWQFKTANSAKKNLRYTMVFRLK